MSHVKTDKLSARTASGTITLGESGETVTLGAGASASGFTSGIVGVSTFTSSGTWTKSTREAALGVTIKKINIIVQGGGSGGGTGSPTVGYGSSGGGAGATSFKYVYDVTSISSATITVGAGGAGATAGGTSSYSDGTLTVSCPGGATGTYNTSGPATGGDVNIEGGGGSSLTYAYTGGKGANSLFGQGGPKTYNTTGKDATGYGAAGSGGGAQNAAGGSGSQGIVIIEEIAG